MRLIRLLAALAASLWACDVAAHVTSAATPGLAWHWDGWVASTAGLAMAAYATGLVRLHRRARLPGRWRALSFALGTTTAIAALLSPLDAMTDRSFAAHMTQHMLLMMVAAPLCAAGRPAVVMFWALEARQRRWLGRRWMQSRTLRGMTFVLQRPLFAWLFATAVLWFWHVPAAYDWALRDATVHVVEHSSFFFSAMLFCSLLAHRSALHRTGHGTAIAMLASFAMHNGLLGALLTFARAPLYSAHAAQMSWPPPLEDQQLAGLIMWIPSGFIHLLAMAWIVWDWLDGSAHRNRRRASMRPRNAPAFSTARIAGNSARVMGLLLSIVAAGARAGDIDRGREAIAHFGCTACHEIPGVAGPQGNVGPPLAGFARRAYIAGVLPNRLDELVRWLREPQKVDPGTAMPDLGVDAAAASDMAAYLYSLD